MESTENIIPKSRAEQSRAEQSRAEQSRAEQSRAEQSRAEQSRNPYIQIIRALCIFAVICIHTCPNGIAQVKQAISTMLIAIKNFLFVRINGIPQAKKIKGKK